MITSGQVEHCIEIYQVSGQVMQTTTGPFLLIDFCLKQNNDSGENGCLKIARKTFKDYMALSDIADILKV